EQTEKTKRQDAKRGHRASTPVADRPAGRAIGRSYTRRSPLSPPPAFAGNAGADHGSALPENDATVPPTSPRVLKTTLNSTETPGVTGPLVMPDWVIWPTKARHSSWYIADNVA